MKRMNYTLIVTVFCAILHIQAVAQAWVSRADVPGAGRLAAFAFSVNSKIYMGGGSGYKDFWEYDPVTNAWTAKAGIPGVSVSRSFGVSFSINGKGYIGLGLDNWPAVATGDKKDLWEYDPATNAWAAKADLPAIARSGCSAMVLGGKAYVVGGADQTAALAEVWAYDPVANTWSRKTDLPTGGLYNPIVFTVSGTGYVTCGSKQSGTPSLKTYAYNPAADQWLPKADFAGSVREAGSSFESGGKGYVGLGATPDYTLFYNDFWVYNPATDAWSLGMPLPGNKRAFAISTVAGNRIFAGAGWNYNSGSDQYFSDWYELDMNNTSSKDAPGLSVQLYPNPARNSIRLWVPGHQTVYTYTIYNQNGEQLQQGSLQEDGLLDINGFADGVYQVVLQSQGSVFNKRFIVSR